jgi:hypothetical protein
MRGVAGIAILALALAAAAGARTQATGLRGLVTKGPTTPVCKAGESCSAPAKHVTLVFTRNGVSNQTTTGDDGRYSIRLAAGAYTVRIPSARFGFDPRTAAVAAGRMATRNFDIDTGIR